MSRSGIKQQDDEIEKLIVKSADFFPQIVEIVEQKDCTYIEAVLEYCKMYNMEIEAASDLIRRNQNLKARIMIEGEHLNLLKKSARLPF